MQAQTDTSKLTKHAFGYGISQWKKDRARLEAYEFMRDDLMSAVKNSGMSFEDIHGRSGPHPSTLQRWLDKMVAKPQLAKMISTMRIIGLREFTIRLGN